MRKLLLVAAAILCGSGAQAAGVDSRVYRCEVLHSIIATNRFVFISQATFGDFVVSDASMCSGGEGGGSGIELRSVPTADTPECLVNYCVKRVKGGA